MGWIQKGLLIVPQTSRPWMRTHAMLPCVDPATLESDAVRVYFSGRDEQNRSRIGWAELCADASRRELSVVRYADEPVLDLGGLGCFDDNGVTPSCILNEGSAKYLYYIGWNRGSTVRMGLVAGLARSEDGGKTFRRVSRAPILERIDSEPLNLNTAPCVHHEQGRWRMWYISGIEWMHPDLPRYDIKYAESADGIHWRRDGRVCIALGPDEHALARPCVLRENGLYKMWYGYKGPNYRIGYAESSDGLTWKRKDAEAGIGPSAGWSDRMQEYAYVFVHRGQKFMLYNGNDYGKDGAGYAVWSDAA